MTTTGGEERLQAVGDWRRGADDRIWCVRTLGLDYTMGDKLENKKPPRSLTHVILIALFKDSHRRMTRRTKGSGWWDSVNRGCPAARLSLPKPLLRAHADIETSEPE